MTDEFPSYARVTEWVRGYGSGGVEDRRAAEEFVVVETRELVDGLRNELIAMSRGRFREEILDQLVGLNRKTRHGSYSEWAKSMLTWLANARP